MINIITGNINSGKTTRLLCIYNAKQQGDGFYSPKIFIDGHYAGQEVVRLSTEERKLFSFKKGFIPEGWDEQYYYHSYSFSNNGFLFVRNIVLDIMQNNIEPIYVDEIGPLELNEQGFYNILNLLLKTDKDMYITVRESCIKDVIKKFRLSDCNIIFSTTC